MHARSSQAQRSDGSLREKEYQSKHEEMQRQFEEAEEKRLRVEAEMREIMEQKAALAVGQCAHRCSPMLRIMPCRCNTKWAFC